MCLVVLAAPGIAQTLTTASLGGRVFDESGKPLPGVTLTLTNPGVAIGAPVAVTGATGDFTFRSLPPGDGYTLKVVMPGCATIIAGPLQLEAGRATVQDFTLKPSKDLEETVRVEARGPTVDTTSATVSTTYGSEFIEGLPLLGRHFTDVLILAPGVTDPDGDGNPNVRGARDTGLQVRLDGTNLNDPLTGHFAQDINLETIEEVEIITSGAPAEYSRADGGFANIITKSGGNQTQGSLKVFYRSNFLDGSGAGNNDQDRRKIVAQDYSDRRSFLTAGGPIVKDHLWYFTSGERLDREIPVLFAAGDSGLRTQRGWNLFAKITWQADTDNKLAVQLNDDPLKYGGNLIGPNYAPESDFVARSGGPLFQLKWTSLLSADLLLEGLVSRLGAGESIESVSDQFRVVRVSSELDTLGYLRANLPCRSMNCQQEDSLFIYRRGSYRGPYWYGNSDRRERTTFRADLSWSLEEALGAHSIKSGFEFADENWADHPVYNPTLYDYTRRGDEFEPPRSILFTWGPIYMTAFDPVRTDESASGWNAGAYVQDAWRPLPNLTVNAGLRVDHELIDSHGLRFFDPAAETRRVLRSFDILCKAYGNACLQNRLPGRTYRGLPALVPLDGLPANHPARRFDLNGDGLVDLYKGSPEYARYIAPYTTPLERDSEGFEISNMNPAPRLSIAWDPFSDGKTRLFGNWGIYYDRLILAEATLEQGPRVYNATWNTDGPATVAQPGAPSEPLAGIDSISQVDRNLATPYTVAWSVGFERELAPEWSISLAYESRRANDLLQDIDVNHITCNLFDSTFHVKPMDVCGDAGRLEMDRFGSLRHADPRDPSTPLYVAPNGADDLYVLNPFWNVVFRAGNFNSSTYRSAELTLRKRLHRNWQMLLSYTWSIARGQAGSYNDPSGDDPALHDTARGFLDYDQRHVLKWQGVTHLPHGLILGGAVLWTSGIPYSHIGFVQDYDDQGNFTFRNYFPTGFKNDQRNAGQWTLDGRIEKRFTMGRVEASAFLSGENLLGSDDVTIYAYTVLARDGRITGGKRFGRRWEIGSSFSF